MGVSPRITYNHFNTWAYAHLTTTTTRILIRENKNFPLNKIAFACTLLLANPVAWAEDQFDASLWGGGSVLGIDFARFNVKKCRVTRAL